MSTLIEALARHAITQPDSIALQSADTRINYRTLFDSTMHIANSLEELGIRRLGLLADNSIEWITIDLAARIAGIALVPLPTFFSHKQLGHIIATADLDALLVEDVVRAENAPGTLPISNFAPGNQRLGGLWLTQRKTASIDLPANAAKVTFTSGSTGSPKGVLLTAGAMDSVAGALATALRAVPMNNHLCVLPLSTLLENIAGVYVPLLRGTTVTVLPPADVGLCGSSQFDASMLLRAIDAYDADSVILTPQLLKVLVGALQNGATLPDSLRFVAVGGGRVATGLLQQARLQGVPVYEGYGLSECSSVVSLNTPSQTRDGSCGKPLAHVNLQIRDGEIFVGGSCCSYLESATASSEYTAPEYTSPEYIAPEYVAPEYIATGDLGHIDDDGFLFITGRRKNLLITTYGRNISPEWIESELLESQVVSQCMVFGDDRPHLGALIFALPTISDKQLAEIIARANQRLPDYARINVWHRLPQPFSVANGLLTENLRLKRDAIGARFQPQIDALYATSIFFDNNASATRECSCRSTNS